MVVLGLSVRAEIIICKPEGELVSWNQVVDICRISAPDYETKNRNSYFFSFLFLCLSLIFLKEEAIGEYREIGNGLRNMEFDSKR